jgi:hypothetical protein
VTIEEFSEEVCNNIELPDGRKEFDPFTLMILMTAIGTVVSHYVEKWLDKCEHKTIRNPTPAQRIRLRLRVEAVFLVKAPKLMTRYSKPVTDAILKTLASKTDDQVGAALAGFGQSLGIE